VSVELEVGERVSLRFPEESDRAEFVTLLRASREHLEPWFPARPDVGDPWGEGAFDRELSERTHEGGERWLVCRVGDGAIVGRVQVSAIERGAFLNGRLGYWIGAGHLRRGYATEAIGLAVRRCFKTLGLHRVEANVMPQNEGSRRALERAGFTRVGRSPRYLQIAGSWEDHEHWAITAD
jgi:ribosomal-protein-alanine N-acetyltransferase